MDEGLLTGTEMIQMQWHHQKACPTMGNNLWKLTTLWRPQHSLQAAWQIWAPGLVRPAPSCYLLLSSGAEAFQDLPSFPFPRHVIFYLLHEHPCWPQGIFNLEHNRYCQPTHSCWSFPHNLLVLWWSELFVLESLLMLWDVGKDWFPQVSLDEASRVTRNGWRWTLLSSMETYVLG